ncbi:MAG TPA: hypothetical protein VGM83_03630, partial [Devosiaceae bacterium]
MRQPTCISGAKRLAGHPMTGERLKAAQFYCGRCCERFQVRLSPPWLYPDWNGKAETISELVPRWFATQLATSKRSCAGFRHVRSADIDRYPRGRPARGFQIEPGPISTADEVRLIEALGETGLRHIQACSFVSPRVVPQWSDAEAVVAQFRPRTGVT